MITSLEKILEENDVPREETVYADSCPEIFEGHIFSVCSETDFTI